MRNGGLGGPFQGRSRRYSPGSERTAHLTQKKFEKIKIKISLEMQKENVFFHFFLKTDVAVSRPRQRSL